MMSGRTVYTWAYLCDDCDRLTADSVIPLSVDFRRTEHADPAGKSCDTWLQSENKFCENAATHGYAFSIQL